MNEIHYIDPVVVAPARKQRGVGRATVQLCLASLAAAGIADVAASITDGNIASERLFAGLGFGRCGEWMTTNGIEAVRPVLGVDCAAERTEDTQNRL